MKNNDIEELLSRRQEGGMGADELEEMNRRCGRDEVVAAADRRVAAIRRGRRVAATVALLVVAGGGLVLLAPRQHEEPRLVAQAEPAGPQLPAVVPLPEPEPTPVAEPAAPTPQPHQTRPASPAVAEAKPTIDERPVVVCNNQCDADSVISDIWRFLSA